MSNISYQNYGILADKLSDQTQVAGRYSCQRDDEGNMLADVTEKLAISSHDTLLDIGCGTGTLLIPLSFAVQSVTGVDHPSCVKVLENRYRADNVSLVAGDFLMLPTERFGSFSKILIYSVLHCLAKDKVEEFILKALAMLEPGGHMLLGDLPNISRKKRFLSSMRGKLFSEEWSRRLDQQEAATVEKPNLQKDFDKAEFDDSKLLTLLEWIRGMGFNAYLLSQPSNLPFGNTREDILVERLE